MNVLQQYPDYAARMAPFIPQVTAIAQKHGVDPNFVFAMIKAESGGNPAIVGDNGAGVGWWQVNDGSLAKFNQTPQSRLNPLDSTARIMPVLARMLAKNNGDWAATRAEYMRGEGWRSGKGWGPIAQSQFDQFKALQGKAGGAPINTVVSPGMDKSALAAFGLTPQDIKMIAPVYTPEQAAPNTDYLRALLL